MWLINRKSAKAVVIDPQTLILEVFIHVYPKSAAYLKNSEKCFFIYC